MAKQETREPAKEAKLSLQQLLHAGTNLSLTSNINPFQGSVS
jgi:hypothetical protein